MFDVTMGSYDGAEVCELVGLFILNILAKHLGKSNVGLYRDDGLAIVKGKNGRHADTIRKKLHNAFQQIGLTITAQVNHQIVNFLDITLNLNNGKFAPFRKPNNQPQYVNSHSNHPPSIIKQIPKSINQRLSYLSSDQQSFDRSKPVHESALKQSNYDFPLQYSDRDATKPSPTTKRKRHRNVIWYNPPVQQICQIKYCPKFPSTHR